MPTYEYICESCGHEFEQLQSITARPLRKCSECGKNQLRRLIGSGAGVIFKGSGFYQTDYRSESYTQAKNKEKSDGKKKAETKTISKETKSDKKPKAKAKDKK
ncbi:MAG: zinc ribbon domain-containing protein [Planctomycetes bacterium]|nr:zinc ribbon domain-containing protein [Planctomycetota bacterium]